MSNGNDTGKRRYIFFPMDFDSRAITLKMEILEEWDPDVKANLTGNRKKVTEELKREYGESQLESKIANFIDIDLKPFSIVAYHNHFFQQVRSSFVVGAYYPSLVAACALAERLLNHLIIDLREFFTAHPEFRRVARKSSFDNWHFATSLLQSWGVLAPGVADAFLKLMPIRHRSIHFNPETAVNVRADALEAILLLSRIIDKQFGFASGSHWMIPGTRGHFFLSKEAENNPFIKTYVVPRSVLVGPLFSMEPTQDGWLVIDHESYGEGDWTDEEFKEEFNNRDPRKLAVRQA